MACPPLGILQYLVTMFKESRLLFEQTAVELGIGSYGAMMTVNTETRLVDVLGVLLGNDMPAIPVIDGSTGPFTLSFSSIYFTHVLQCQCTRPTATCFDNLGAGRSGMDGSWMGHGWVMDVLQVK